MQHEVDRRKIVAQLLSEGWTNVGGGNHDVFRKAGHPRIVVPRHRTVTIGVAANIAKLAGWPGKDKE